MPFLASLFVNLVGACYILMAVAANGGGSSCIRADKQKREGAGAFLLLCFSSFCKNPINRARVAVVNSSRRASVTSASVDRQLSRDRRKKLSSWRQSKKKRRANSVNSDNEVDRYPWEIEFSELEFRKKRIAVGAFGSIHLATWMNTEVAVKMPSDDLSPKALDDFMCEVELMSTAHHPNIVVFLGACITQPNIW